MEVTVCDPLAVSSREWIKTLAAILFWPQMCALFRICVFITYKKSRPNNFIHKFKHEHILRAE